MRALTVIVALALQASLVGCATSTEQIVTCPPGKELNADGTDCVPIRCVGGDIVDGVCNCPGDQVLVAGACRDPDDPCIELGNCVECNQAVDCPEVTEACKAKSCEDNRCGSNAIAADGTLCDGGAGVCQGGVCEPSDLCLDAEVRCNDDEECTQDLCNPDAGSCTNPPVENGSTLCASGAGECVDGQCDLCKRVSCRQPVSCMTESSCNPETGLCEDGDPLPDGTDCDSGTPAGACLQAMCVPIAPPDDDVDPYALPVVFNRGATMITDTVSYPLGDTEDVVFYSVSSITALGQLVINAFCDGDGAQHIRFIHRGTEYQCNPTGVTVVDRLIGPDIPGTGSVTITAVDGQGTFVSWTLEGTALPN